MLRLFRKTKCHTFVCDNRTRDLPRSSSSSSWVNFYYLPLFFCRGFVQRVVFNEDPCMQHPKYAAGRFDVGWSRHTGGRLLLSIVSRTSIDASRKKMSTRYEVRWYDRSIEGVAESMQQTSSRPFPFHYLVDNDYHHTAVIVVVVTTVQQQ